jgi:pSer/pThr/pTyr-binding forkhead associated (FHA) protein
MSGGGGGETRIRRQGEPVAHDDTLDDISTQLIRDKSNQVVGTLTVTEGPGAGNSVKIYTGTNQIGRGDDMRVQLNFGDDTISRQQHAVITFDAKNLEARIYDGGKPGGLWVNGARVVADQQIKFGDVIKIGETTLKLEQP